MLTADPGARQDVAQKQATFQLFYGSLAPTALSSISLAISATAGLEVVPEPLQSELPPGKQFAKTIAVRCVGPYALPTATLSFVVNGSARQIQFRLPLPISRFMEPVALEPGPFMATWGKVPAGAPLEGQQVVTLPPAAADGSTDLVAAAVAKLTKLGLQAVPQADPKPTNLVAASKFGSVPIMLRVETAAGKARLTLRSTDATVTAEVLAQVAFELAAP